MRHNGNTEDGAPSLGREGRGRGQNQAPLEGAEPWHKETEEKENQIGESGKKPPVCTAGQSPIYLLRPVLWHPTLLWCVDAAPQAAGHRWVCGALRSGGESVLALLH